VLPDLFSNASRLKGQAVKTKIRDRFRTHQPHHAIDFLSVNFEHVPDAGFAADGETPKLRPANQATGRAERERLHDIGAAPDASVDEDRQTAADGFKN
jgi:hypothetical protein